VENSQQKNRVYCIEVADAHSYYVKSGNVGFLVSNCDATRYCISTLYKKIQNKL
jgi:hypothetical protein